VEKILSSQDELPFKAFARSSLSAEQNYNIDAILFRIYDSI
jgi:hypothetical protein